MSHLENKDNEIKQDSPTQENKPFIASEEEAMQLLEASSTDITPPESNGEQLEASFQEEPPACAGGESLPSSKKGKSAKTSQPPSHSKELTEFIDSLEKVQDPDAKITMAVEKMEAFLSQGGTPQFKNFWELRKVCLELFKLNISPGVRAALWPKYSELSKEARRLKEIYDEQSAFAVEQIDIAINALETDVKEIESKLAEQQDVDFKHHSKHFESKEQFYNEIQKKLNLLNAHAARINNLRRELMRIDMRVKFKNKFFQRLSAIGDHVFPLRKDLIKEVSDQFLGDVDAFIQQHFSTDPVQSPVFYLREEIKALQGIAKALTLNTHAFSVTRRRLSECWDRIKVVDKERKKERAEKKDLFQQNKVELETKIGEVKEKFVSGMLSLESTSELLDTLQLEMRKAELGHDEVKELRAVFAAVRKLAQDKRKVDEENRLLKQKERIQQKNEFVSKLMESIESLKVSAETMKAADIETQKEALLEEISNSKDLSPREKHEFQRNLRSLRDVVTAKRENELLSLSENDQVTLNNLKEILQQRKSRRKDIKEQVDSLRKAAGSSGLDFEKAMKQNEQLALEKELLDKADDGIREIENKIRQFKKSGK